MSAFENNTLLTAFRDSFVPHVIEQRLACSDLDFGCVPDDLANASLRAFVEDSQLLREWLSICVPRVRSNFRLGVGCDPKSIEDLDTIYGEHGAIPDLIHQRIFIFAEDGSGYAYCLQVDTGEVILVWGAWGGANDKEFGDVVVRRWTDLADFANWLSSTFE